MNFSKNENRIIGGIFILIALFIFLTTDKSKQYISSDAEGYYMYLPALTIYGFSNIPVRSTSQFLKVESTGNYYDKYTSGVAIMEAPFYALACFSAAISSKYDIDGYSQPFQRSVLLASLFYSFLGLFILYKILRKEYPPPLFFSH